MEEGGENFYRTAQHTPLMNGVNSFGQPGTHVLTRLAFIYVIERHEERAPSTCTSKGIRHDVKNLP